MWLTLSVAVESGKMPEHSIVTIECCLPANTQKKNQCPQLAPSYEYKRKRYMQAKG
jgi:hypothetical protein